MSGLDDEDEFFADIYDDDKKDDKKEAKLKDEKKEDNVKEERKEEGNAGDNVGNANANASSVDSYANYGNTESNHSTSAATSNISSIPDLASTVSALSHLVRDQSVDRDQSAESGESSRAFNTGNIYIPPKDEGKMFVGGLNWETTDESLKNYFSKFGGVLECNIMRDNVTGRSRGFGFLTLDSVESVNRVVAQSEHYLDGKIIDPKRAIPRAEQNKTAKIFVGGVGVDVTDYDFKQFFDRYGVVIDAQLMLDKDTGRPRGFGFVTFDSEDAVEKILSESVLILKNKAIEVKRAEPRGGKGGNIGDRGGRLESANDPYQSSRGNNNSNRGGRPNQQGGNYGGGYEPNNYMGAPGMTPQMMTQYYQWMYAMRQQMATQGGAAGAAGGDPAAMMSMMQQQQQQQQMQQLQQGQQPGSPDPSLPQPRPYEDIENETQDYRDHDENNRGRNRNNYRERDRGDDRWGNARSRSRSPPSNAPSGPRGGGPGGRRNNGGGNYRRNNNRDRDRGYSGYQR